MVGWASFAVRDAREREREGEKERGGMDRTSRLKERLGYEGIRDSADIHATGIFGDSQIILLNVAELLNNTFMYFLTFIYRIVSLRRRERRRGKIFRNW